MDRPVPTKHDIYRALSFPKLSSQNMHGALNMLSAMSRFLSPVSMVSARNAQDHDPRLHFDNLVAKKLRLIIFFGRIEIESCLLRRLRSLSFSFDLKTTVTDWPDLAYISSTLADFAGANDIIT